MIMIKDDEIIFENGFNEPIDNNMLNNIKYIYIESEIFNYPPSAAH